MAAIPLEDNFTDIIGKATRGHGLSREQLATKVGEPPEKVKALFSGELDEALLRKVAPALGLAEEPLLESAHKAWEPIPISLPGLAQFNSTFEDMTVNAYVAWDEESREAVVFDTGGDASDLLALLKKEAFQVVAILVTHTHGDHIFELDRVVSHTGAEAFVGDREELSGTTPFSAGREFTCGKLRIESRLTWGHSKGGITYVIHGLSQPVAIVGDAIFAGSMGGGAISFEDALRTNRKEIMSLPENTVICPGHGPLSTVGEERKHNPFFAVS